MNAPLPLDTIARIRAEIDAGLPKEKVLADAGLSKDTWSAAEAAFMLKLAAEASRGRFDESRKFVSAMEEAKRAAAEKAVENRKLEAPAKPIELPPAAVALPMPPLPEIIKSPEIKLQPPPEIPPESAAPITAPVASEAGKKAPLPFTQPTASTSAVHATMALPAFTEENAPDSDGLPFQKATAKQAQKETMAMPAFTEENAPDSDGLPFVSPKQASTPPPAPPRAPPAVAPSPEARAKAERVTLAVYARLCADVRKYPQHVAQIRAHYALDDATWTAVHLLWRERFERDPTLRDRWLALIQQHLGRA